MGDLNNNMPKPLNLLAPVMLQPNENLLQIKPIADHSPT